MSNLTANFVKKLSYYHPAHPVQGEAERKQEHLESIRETIADESFDHLDILTERYEKIIKNLNKNRKKGFKDFDLAWKGICPGCDKCMGDGG